MNYPDVSMLPSLASYFNVTTDYLLGIERNESMAKLLRTTEVFELNTRQEAEEMLLKFKGEKFPVLKSHDISEVDGKVILEVTKEFNSNLDNMKFD